MENTLLPENAGFDTPNILDWNYADVIPEDYWSSTQLDREVLLTRLIAYNQYTNPKTRSGCGWYGLTHVENAMRILQDADFWTEKQVDPAPRRVYRNENERPASSRWNGTSLQGNLNLFVNRKWISWYAYANAITESQRAIDNWHLIYTGTNQCDWRKTYETWVFTPAGKTTTGHLFAIVEYNDDGFIIRESNWPKRWKVLIKYEDVNYLYSRVAVIPVNNADLILKYRTMNKYQKEIQTSIENGFTNGERPKDAAIREEVGVVALRAYARSQAYTDAKVVVLEEKINALVVLIQKLANK